MLCVPLRLLSSHPRYVSNHFRFHDFTPTSARALNDILGRMPDSMLVEVSRLNAPSCPVKITVTVARAIALHGNWGWRGSASRIKKMKEVADQRHSNHWQSGYRQTAAPIDALRGIGEDADLWSDLTQTHRIETRIPTRRIPVTAQ
jgi:hypothetical protein